LEGFLSHDGAGLGLFAWPLGRVFEAARGYIESRGGVVRTATGVTSIHVEGSRVRTVETEDGETVDVDAGIVAVPPWDLKRILAEPWTADLFEATDRLAWSPIVDVHLWFDRPVLEDELLVVVESPLQAVFDVTRIHTEPASSEARPASERAASSGGIRSVEFGGFHVVLSMSAADRWIDRPAQETVEELVSALSDRLANVGAAKLVHHLVIRHRRATFVPEPDADAYRPGSVSGIAGLHLAGDWTSTGWPSTIEGAVRSGIAAAGRAAEDLEPKTASPLSVG
jgi:protoporphyrinogen oxidase